MTLEQLYIKIQKRIISNDAKSYTVALTKDGEDRIIQKVGEEAVEVVIAAKNQEKQLLINEVADLFYHINVLLAYKNVSLDDIYNVLERRDKNKSS